MPGALLLESVAAVIVLFAAMAATVRLLGVVADSRRSAENRQFAVEAAANAMERIAALPVEERTSKRLEQVGFDPESARRLPEGRLRAAFSSAAKTSDTPELARVVVDVHWRGAAGRSEAPVRLTAWFATQGAER